MHRGRTQDYPTRFQPAIGGILPANRQPTYVFQPRQPRQPGTPEVKPTPVVQVPVTTTQCVPFNGYDDQEYTKGRTFLW